MAREEPAIYDVLMSKAVEASAAAPIYFAPKTLADQVLVDGGLIANNPALLAVLHAKKVSVHD